MQLSFVSAQAPPGHSVCPSLGQGTDELPFLGMAFVLTVRSRTCSLTQLRSCRSQARVTAWLGFGCGCPLDSEWLFLARGRKHREGQKCVLQCSCRLDRNLSRSCRREGCPQEGKDDPGIEIIWSEGFCPLPTSTSSGIEAPMSLCCQCGYKSNCAF